MDSDFKTRLVEFARKQYDLGMTRFEEKTGINSGTINKIRDGISTTTLAKIAAACPELNLRWLLLGEGEMLEEPRPHPATTVNIQEVHTVNIGNWGDLANMIAELIQKKQ